MPIALHSFKIEANGTIDIKHTTYAETYEEAFQKLAAHADTCPKFGPAFRSDSTIQVSEEIDALPTPETVDDFVGGDTAEDDED